LQQTKLIDTEILFSEYHKPINQINFETHAMHICCYFHRLHT